MTDQYVCLVCKNIAGTPAQEDTENWFWVTRDDHPRGRSGPFCSKTCVAAFNRWSRPQRLAAIFGSYARGIGAEKMRPEHPAGATYIPIFDTITGAGRIQDWHKRDWSGE